MQRGFPRQPTAASEKRFDHAGVLRCGGRFRQRWTARLSAVSRHVEGIFDGKTELTLTEGKAFDKPIALVNWLHD